MDDWSPDLALLKRLRGSKHHVGSLVRRSSLPFTTLDLAGPNVHQDYPTWLITTDLNYILLDVAATVELYF
jgi:hypothetical protein